MHPTPGLLKVIRPTRLVISILANHRKMPHRPSHGLAFNPSHVIAAREQVQLIVGPVFGAAVPPLPIRLPANSVVAVFRVNTASDEVDVGDGGTPSEGPKRDLCSAHPSFCSGTVGSAGVAAVRGEDGDNFVVGGVGGEGVECEVEGRGDIGFSTLGGDAGREAWMLSPMRERSDVTLSVTTPAVVVPRRKRKWRIERRIM